MEIYGYARVSSKDQNVQRQLDAFYKEGIDDKHILIDKKSGKTFDRNYYNLLVGTENTAALLRKGDCLVIVDLDRLGRNYTEIQQQWRRITDDIGANIKVLDMPLLNTCAAEDSLDRKFMRDLVFQILSYVAEKERNNIKERQRQGIESAKAAGKNVGRPAATFPENWEEVYNAWNNREILSKTAMEITGLKNNTFYNLAERWEKERGTTRAVYYRRVVNKEE